MLYWHKWQHRTNQGKVNECVCVCVCVTMSRVEGEPTFAQFKGEPLPPVSAGVKRRAVQQGPHVVDEHLVSGHGQLCARALSLHQLHHTHTHTHRADIKGIRVKKRDSQHGLK